MNALIKKILRPRLGLTELVSRLILLAKDRDNKSLTDSALCTNPLFDIHVIKDAANTYSNFCVKMLMESLKDSFALDCRNKSTSLWIVSRLDEKFEVSGKKSGYDYSCSFYSSWGIPYAHIMKVLMFRQEKTISKCIFFQRWLNADENVILRDELLLMNLIQDDFAKLLKISQPTPETLSSNGLQRETQTNEARLKEDQIASNTGTGGIKSRRAAEPT